MNIPNNRVDIGYEDVLYLMYPKIKRNDDVPSENKSRIHVVYTAGSYRWRGTKLIPKLIGELFNIFKAWKVAKELWKNGFVVVCPHSNSILMDKFGVLPEAFLYGDLLLVERCDAVLMLPGWEKSAGATKERDHALACNIPVFYSTKELCYGA